MQVVLHARRAARVLGAPPIRLYWELLQFRSQSSLFDAIAAPSFSLISRSYHTSHCTFDARMPLALADRKCYLQYPIFFSLMPRASFSSDAGTEGSDTTAAVKELYDKIFKSVVDQRTAPPNAWLWSLIEKCANQEDVMLLFNILQRLRVFRLANLRIHENFNSALCLEIARACVRVGAIDYGKKVLTKHNIYGLTPTIGSANHLLLHAKQKNNEKLMVEIMKLVKKSDLPLQPGTADIVLSICYKNNNWELMSKCAKKFVKGGVKLRQASFDIWMEFAARTGDIDSLWEIEKLRSESMKQHTLATGFSCAKGFLLERKPDNAAAIIHVLDQTLFETKRQGIVVELQKLISEWSLEVLKSEKEENKKALAAALQDDIPTMVSALLNKGLEVNVNMEDLTREEPFSS